MSTRHIKFHDVDDTARYNAAGIRTTDALLSSTLPRDEIHGNCYVKRGTKVAARKYRGLRSYATRRQRDRDAGSRVKNRSRNTYGMQQSASGAQRWYQDRGELNEQYGGYRDYARHQMGSRGFQGSSSYEGGSYEGGTSSYYGDHYGTYVDYDEPYVAPSERYAQDDTELYLRDDNSLFPRRDNRRRYRRSKRYTMNDGPSAQGFSRNEKRYRSDDENLDERSGEYRPSRDGFYQDRFADSDYTDDDIPRYYGDSDKRFTDWYGRNYQRRSRGRNRQRTRYTDDEIPRYFGDSDQRFRDVYERNEDKSVDLSGDRRMRFEKDYGSRAAAFDMNRVPTEYYRRSRRNK